MDFPSFQLDETTPPGSPDWWALFALLLFARAADLGSTWVATPNLKIEGNPVARKLGWRWGLPMNVLLALAFPCWPLLAIAMTTTSLLVATRNLQHAWIMRAMGEDEYRDWFSYVLGIAGRRNALASSWSESALMALVGALLLWSTPDRLVPFAVGFGALGYSVAVAVFTTLALRNR